MIVIEVSVTIIFLGLMFFRVSIELYFVQFFSVGALGDSENYNN